MGDVKSKVLYILEKDLGLLINSYDEKLEFESIDEVELVMCLEEEFSIGILDEDVEKLDTVNNIMRYINGKNI